MRAATTRCCRALASAHPIKPRLTTEHEFICRPRAAQIRRSTGILLGVIVGRIDSGTALHVNLQAAYGCKSVAHGFPYRGVSVNHVHHVVDGAFEIQHRGGFGQKFSGQRADDVNAQHFAIFLVGDHFDETTVVAEDSGLAVTDKGELSDFYLIAGGNCFFFREPDRADLRFAIGGVRNAGANHLLRGFAGDRALRR